MRCLLEASWLSQRRHRSEMFQVSKPSNNNRLLAYHRQTCSVDSNRISPFAELSLGSSPSTRVIDLKLVADCFNHLELTSRSVCLGLSIGSNLARNCSLKKNPKKIRKIQGFFWGFKIRISYLEVNNSSNSVFKSFFIHKILVHPKKSWKNPKNPKNQKIRNNRKNPEKFENLNKPKKSEKIHKTRKNLKNLKKSKKSEKNPKNLKKIQGFFCGFKIRKPSQFGWVVCKMETFLAAPWSWANLVRETSRGEKAFHLLK